MFASPGSWPVDGVGAIEGLSLRASDGWRGILGSVLEGDCRKAGGKLPRDDLWEIIPWTEYVLW